MALFETTSNRQIPRTPCVNVKGQPCSGREVQNNLMLPMYSVQIEELFIGEHHMDK
jgi:hypothetical protein